MSDGILEPQKPERRRGTDRRNIMRRLIRAAVFTLVIAAIATGFFAETKTTSAANGYEQWVDFGDGCAYYWDGYGYTWSGCARTDGGFDFYVANYGQWSYFFTTIPDTAGGVYTYYEGVWYYTPPASSAFDTWYPDMSVIGGWTWGNSSGKQIANAITSDSNTRVIDNVLSPNCAEEYAGVCYVW
jgi:hypothetical protein